MRKEVIIPDIFKTTPIVYAVSHEYQIFIPVNAPCVMWIEVDGYTDHAFYDDINGVLRSDVKTHKIVIPMDILDEAKGYTVCFRCVIERKPYFSELNEVETYHSEFRPVPTGNVRIYHIADAHNRVEAPIKCASYFEDGPDLLIMNGDIPNHAGEDRGLETVVQIASRVTKGEIPVIFARGNHDTRGAFAEHLFDIVPTFNGDSYYTVTLGNMWFLVLDCGEDKPDSNDEYGGVNCFEDFRRRETLFIEDVIRRASEEYNAKGIKHRILLCHVPFTFTPKEPFNIELDTYGYWARMMREDIKPEMMLCGHLHKALLCPVGCGYDNKGQACPLVLASQIIKKNGDYMVGGAITVSDKAIDIVFNQSTGEIIGTERIELG